MIRLRVGVDGFLKVAKVHNQRRAKLDPAVAKNGPCASGYNQAAINGDHRLQDHLFDFASNLDELRSEYDPVGSLCNKMLTERMQGELQGLRVEYKRTLNEEIA